MRNYLHCLVRYRTSGEECFLYLVGTQGTISLGISTYIIIFLTQDYFFANFHRHRRIDSIMIV